MRIRVFKLRSQILRKLTVRRIQSKFPGNFTQIKIPQRQFHIIFEKVIYLCKT